MNVEKNETTMIETFNYQGECLICSDEYEKLSVPLCHHVFCLVCLDVKWCCVKADFSVCKMLIKSFKDDNGKEVRVPQDLDKFMKKVVRRRHRRHPCNAENCLIF